MADERRRWKHQSSKPMQIAMLETSAEHRRYMAQTPGDNSNTPKRPCPFCDWAVREQTRLVERGMLTWTTNSCSLCAVGWGSGMAAKDKYEFCVAGGQAWLEEWAEEMDI